MSEPRILLCYRKDDMPVPSARSFTDACSKCGAAIWVAYSSPSDAKRICLLCAGPILKDPNTKLEVTESIAADAVAIMKRKPQ